MLTRFMTATIAPIRRHGLLLPRQWAAALLLAGAALLATAGSAAAATRSRSR